MGKEILPFDVESIESLKGYHWPGNVRELQNVIERAVITAREGRINFDQILPSEENLPSANIADPPEHSVKTVQQLSRLERDNLLLALERSEWRVSGPKGAAQLVGIPPSTFQSKMKALGIKRPH